MNTKEDADSNNESKKSFFKFDRISWILIILSGLLLIFSCFAPLILNLKSWVGTFNCKPNELGDTIGGLMSPFIAISGVILTFLAFYIQYKANINLSEQIKSQRANDFLDKMIQNFSNIQDSIEIETFNLNFATTETSETKGKKSFKIIQNEFILSNYLISKYYKKGYRIAFKVTFLGITGYLNNVNEFYKEDTTDYDLFFRFKDAFLKRSLSQIDQLYKEIKIDDLFINKRPEMYISTFSGHKNELRYYFNSFFNIIDSIFYNNFISDDEKKYYYKIVNSMLSIEEQNIIFLYIKAYSYDYQEYIDLINNGKLLSDVDFDDVYGMLALEFEDS